MFIQTTIIKKQLMARFFQDFYFKNSSSTAIILMSVYMRDIRPGYSPLLETRIIATKTF